MEWGPLKPFPPTLLGEEAGPHLPKQPDGVGARSGQPSHRTTTNLQSSATPGRLYPAEGGVGLKARQGVWEHH